MVIPQQITKNAMTIVRIWDTVALRPWKSTTVVTIEKNVTGIHAVRCLLNFKLLKQPTYDIVCWCDLERKVSNPFLQ